MSKYRHNHIIIMSSKRKDEMDVVFKQSERTQSEASCSGWLRKKAHKSKVGWKKRWFELHGHVLSYYKKKEDQGSKPRGVMTLTGDSKVRIRDLDGRSVPDGCEVDSCVEVNSPTASLIFAASDEKNQDKWVDAFRKVISTIKELHEMNADRDKGKAPKEVRGMHSFNVHGSNFHVDRKYKLIKPIGHGAYGVVVSAKDEESKRKVAIKKVSNAFEDLVDAKRILREIKLLRHFNHENIIRIVDVQEPPSLKDFNDVYIVTDLMETDLHRVIYSKQILSDDHIRYFVYQILKALKYMHSAGVLHRDIKPSNLLLNADCDLKLCDFGLARGVEDEAHTLTEYVVTRWYRAPEIMLACPTYTNAIDVWATGCILAELYGRQPIFPGHDYLHQLKLISDYIGMFIDSCYRFV